MNSRLAKDRREYVIKPQEGVSPLKAQVLGFLAGDGCVAARRGRAINTDPHLLRWFSRAVEEVYGVTPSSTTTSRNRIKPLTELFLCKAITLDLHSLATWGIHEWCVPQAVKDGREPVKAAYVRGFFDAEGTVFMSVGIGSPNKHHNNVSGTSANKEGLLELAQIMHDLGIGHGFYPSVIDGKTYWKLQVHKRSEVLRFADKVGFESPCKRKALERVRTFPPVRKKGELYERRLARISSLGLEEEVAPKVARAIDCSVKQVWDARRWARKLKAAKEVS